MPCTRSMVTRSVSKTSTKSGRAAAAAADDDDMPPPVSPPPKPKARSTRGKKASKQPSEDSEEATTSKSSVSSARSTRNKPRSKAESVEEEVESDTPPSKPSRSTRQKPRTETKPPSTVNKILEQQSKVTKQVLITKTPKTVSVSANSKSSTVKPKTEEKTKASTSKGPSKRPARVRAKKTQIESDPDDFSTEEEIHEPKKKNLTLEQLHKQHVNPFKTALSYCGEVPKILRKIADTNIEDRMEKEFQALMDAKDMPPPPAPKAKGKGRKKRNRSPEPASSKTDLPASFNFADNQEDAPAKKKFILDVPETESDPVVPTTSKTSKVRAAKNLVQESEMMDAKEVEDKIRITNKSDKESEAKKGDKASDSDIPQKEHQPSQAADKKTIKKTKRVKKGAEESSASEQEKIPSQIVDEKSQKQKDAVEPPAPSNQSGSDEKEGIKEAIAADNGPKDPQSSNTKTETDLRSKSNEIVPQSAPTSKDSETTDNDKKTATNTSVPINQLDAKNKEIEKSISPIIKLEANENNIKQTNLTPEACGGDVESNNVRIQGNEIGIAGTPATNKKVMEETFVFETPKDNGKDGAKATPLNTTFTPELCFSETPKSSRPLQNLNETVVISKSEEKILAPESPEPASANVNSANGKVHSLVKYFDKQKGNASNSASNDCKSDEIEKGSNITPAEVDNNPNATFVLPTVKKDTKPTSMMNVTVCLKKGDSADSTREENSLTPVLPPQNLPANVMHESAASRTFIKEPPSLTVVMEEEDERNARLSKQSDVNRPIVKLNSKLGAPDNKDNPKDAKKGVSSSSSSSGSSMKSASSQPCLNKFKSAVSSKNGPTHGSTGKLNDVLKSKPLEEAEKRRQELINQKVEQQKKKNEEWRKKAEKNTLEEAKKLKEIKEKAEKAKAIQPATSSSNLLKKPVPFSKPTTDIGPVSGFMKPKTTFGMAVGNAKALGFGAVGGPKVLPSLAKPPFQKQNPIPPVVDLEMDESFKTPSSSFLDGTMDGHLSSYDITVYEDLDEDLKHRENKVIPKWASDKEALKEALFSMVLLSEYQYKIPSCFPKPDKNFRLFPNKNY